MSIFFQKGDLVQIPADAPYYRVDCDSTGVYPITNRSATKPLLAIYLYFDEYENKATVWIDNQEYKVGIKYVQWHQEAMVC